MSKIDQRRRLARQLENLIDQSGRVFWSAERQCGEPESHVPAMDMYEAGDWLTIEIELPGLNREAIEVFVEGQTIFVTAVKTDAGPCTEPVSGKVSYQQVERKYGRFHREILLPVPCNTHDAHARFKNGVLLLEFKKVPDRRGERRRLNLE